MATFENATFGPAAVTHRTAINTKSSRLVEFKAAQITSPGSVELRGRPGESVGGFTLGVIQLEYIETNHARYRGATAADGSILQIRDRPPARPSQLCRDTDELVKPVSWWYDPPGRGPATSVLPVSAVIPPSGVLPLTIQFFDEPADTYDVTLLNTEFTPPRPNRLHSSQVAFHFCTMLAVFRPGASHPEVLKHFYWNVRWGVRFSAGGAGVRIDGLEYMSVNVQNQVHSGVPNDRRFASRVFDLSLPVCNLLASTPGTLRASRGW